MLIIFEVPKIIYILTFLNSKYKVFLKSKFYCGCINAINHLEDGIFLNIANSFIKASFWSFLTEIVAKTISPLVFLVMTWILSPKDFGIVSVALVIMSFVNVISDMGMSKTIIQESGDEEYLNKIKNVAFWFNLVIGIFIFFILVLFAQELANFYGAPESVNVIRVMAIQIIFSSISSVQNAIRKKDLDFKSLFYIRLITVLVPVIISLPLAFSGFGFWALVYGNVAASVASTLVLWFTSEWKPIFSFDFRVLKYILSKGLWNTFESICLWIPISLDAMLISKHLSTTSLGLYTTSRNLFTIVVGILLSPLLPVLFSTLSKINYDNVKFKSSILLSQKVIFTISAIMGISVYIFRDLIELVFFNSNWKGIADIFGVIFLVFGIEYFCSAIVEGLRAKGHFKLISLNTFMYTVISIPLLYFAVLYGIEIYVWVRSLLLFLQFPIIIIYSKKILNITFSEYLGNTKEIIVCVTTLFFINQLLINYLSFSKVITNILMFLSFVSIGLLLIILEKRNLKLVITRIKEIKIKETL
jgi:O-antigen/teichoic acid export membrane protein